MRKAVLRVAAIGATAALTTLVLPVSPAAALTSDACNYATSVRLLTTPIFGSEDNRLWVDSPTTTRLLVCFDIPFANIGSGVIVADAATGGVTVTPGSNPAACGFVLLNPSDPVAFRLAVDVLTSTVCLTIGGETKTLTFTQSPVTGPPSIQIWLDGSGDWLDVAPCAKEYVLYVAGAGPNTCWHTNKRIL